jgi:anti-sigma factor RsiW
MSGEAQALASSDLLKALIDGLEKTAMDQAINADPTNDEARRAYLGEVRAIRAFRGRLAALLRERTGPDNPVV